MLQRSDELVVNRNIVGSQESGFKILLTYVWSIKNDLKPVTCHYWLPTHSTWFLHILNFEIKLPNSVIFDVVYNSRVSYPGSLDNPIDIMTASVSMLTLVVTGMTYNAVNFIPTFVRNILKQVWCTFYTVKNRVKIPLILPTNFTIIIIAIKLPLTMYCKYLKIDIFLIIRHNIFL